MFDEDPPVFESDAERSSRHARMVFQASFFVVFLSVIMFAFAALWVWLRDGAVDLGALFVPFLIVVAGLALGLAYEVKKRW